MKEGKPSSNLDKGRTVHGIQNSTIQSKVLKPFYVLYTHLVVFFTF